MQFNPKINQPREIAYHPITSCSAVCIFKRSIYLWIDLLKGYICIIYIFIHTCTSFPIHWQVCSFTETKSPTFYMYMYQYAPDVQSETRFTGIHKDLTGITLILMEINYPLLIIKVKLNTITLAYYVNYLTN